MNLLRKHIESVTLLGLFVIFYFIFFHNIGTYPLMDMDETRYALMSRDMFHSKDFLTLYLNGQYFFEKPPLYFWGECLSFWIFGVVNEFTVRFPVALYGMLSAFLIYFAGKKVVSREYGIVSSLILATSLEFTILSKYAILDIVVTFCIGFSLYFGFLTFFCKEENKKFFWWLFYIFSGLAVMAKGIPGFVVPFGVMFFASIISKKFKELFKPIYCIPGLLLFLLISLPWHIIMLKIHNPLFFEQYIMEHHVHRFINSANIGRKEPWYFFILVYLWGFIPWVLSAIATISTRFKDIFKFFKNGFAFDKLNNQQKFLVLNGIAFMFIMLFFSASSTKLVTYILPLFLPNACLMGWVWTEYIKNGANTKAINISVYIFSGVCVLAGIIALFTKFFLPTQIYQNILTFKWLAIFLILTFNILAILFALKKQRLGVFISYVAFVLLLSAFGTGKIFKIDYAFGQNDLIQYAKYAKENNYTINAISTGNRYSLLFYGDKIKFYDNFDNAPIPEMVRNPKELMLVRKDEMENFQEKTVNYKVIFSGCKYNLLKGDVKVYQ